MFAPNSPMERVKMLNMREETMLRRHLEAIGTLEKKQLHSINKDTIGLRMELRAHRFRAMKTSVRQKGALQEFDEQWRARKEQLARAQLKQLALGGAQEEGEGVQRRRTRSVHERLYQSAGGSLEMAPPQLLIAQRVRTTEITEQGARASDSSGKGITPRTSAVTPKTPTVNGRTSAKSLSSAKSREGATSQVRGSPVCRSSSSKSRGPPSSPGLRRQNSTPRPPEGPPPAHRRASTHSSRRANVQVSSRGSERKGASQDYMERTLQAIAGGPNGTKVAAERGGNNPEALLAKLGTMRFDEYTDGTLAMEIRKLKQKMSGNQTVLYVPATNPNDALLPPSQRGRPPVGGRKPPHTAPPAGRRHHKQAGSLPSPSRLAFPVHVPTVARRRAYDSEKAMAQENEGLLRLHREGQRQEYEQVLRRVKTFLGKPTSSPLLKRDRLTAEDVLLLNKVRPPRTRLKGAVKLVIFLNKAKSQAKPTDGANVAVSETTSRGEPRKTSSR